MRSLNRPGMRMWDATAMPENDRMISRMGRRARERHLRLHIGTACGAACPHLTSSSAPTQDKPADIVCRGQLIFAIVRAHAGVAREGGRCADDVKSISMSPYVRAK